MKSVESELPKSPIPNSYRVPDSRIIAGEYPGETPLGNLGHESSGLRAYVAKSLASVAPLLRADDQTLLERITFNYISRHFFNDFGLLSPVDTVRTQMVTQRCAFYLNFHRAEWTNRPPRG